MLPDVLVRPVVVATQGCVMCMALNWQTGNMLKWEAVRSTLACLNLLTRILLLDIL